jgi:hypothetical protein
LLLAFYSEQTLFKAALVVEGDHLVAQDLGPTVVAVVPVGMVGM